MANLKSSFSKGLTTLNVKTSNFMKQNEIKTHISTLEGEIKELKYQIGDLAFNAHIKGVNCDTAIQNILKTIQEKYEIIEGENQKIQDLLEKEKQILGAGGANSQGKFCTQCGQPNGIHYKFCEKCGAPLQ